MYDLRNLEPSHQSCNESLGDRELDPVAAVVESGIEFFSRP